ncbi:glycosyltransferase family protein [Leucobacter tenebrionis]|uniref:hypothetical protein n=1 Tax=Leucobacter tenebrionis TaxID=2873270 RepID=UPI001CA6CD66|nr:hypothetical protein [Leucobacter tenebrionis]QZY51171.1 hypothetical protein KVY00_11230 [Leucobacter tenebrionis]
MHPVAERLWRAMPKIAQDTIATSVDRARGVKAPPTPLPDPAKPYRVLIGPVNYAGQGHLWARALESTGLVSAKNYVHSGNNPLGYPADFTMSWRTAEHSRAWQKDMVETLSNHYTHVFFEACMPVLGGLFKGDILKQVELLESRGLTVGMIGHGNEIRLPSAHVAREPWSQFRDGVWESVDIIEPVAAGNLELLERLQRPTFVSTAGLLEDVPSAKLIGVIVDPDRWANDEPLLVRDRIRVVHAPTNPKLKGTTHVAPVARKLHDEGVIEYVELEGIPHSEMPRVFAEADVVLDQFRVGDYGVAACETMAAGRVVLAHVSEQVREEVERQAGMPLPIPETTLDSVEEVLRDIASIDGRERYRRIAAQGPEFVRRLHDGRFSRGVLMDFIAGTATAESDGSGNRG